MATRSQIQKALREHQKKAGTKETDFGPLMKRAVMVEIRTEEALRRARGTGRRKWDYITKKKARYKQHPWLTGAGMAGRAGVVITGATLKAGAKGTYKLGRGTGKLAKTTARGYKRRVHPKVAGLSEKAFTGNATTELARAGRRMRARTRVTRRRVAGRIHDHANTYAPARGHRMSYRARVEHRVADALDTRRHRSRGALTRCASCGAVFRTVAAAAKHQCGTAARREQEAIRRARIHVAGKPRNTSKSSANTRSNMGRTPAMAKIINTKQAANAVDASVRPKTRNGKHIDLRGYEATNFTEWLELCYGKAREHDMQAEALNAHIEHQEGKNKMDPRATAPLSLAVELEQQLAKLYLGAYAESWRLYRNRISADGDTGRRMTNEDTFFKV